MTLEITGSSLPRRRARLRWTQWRSGLFGSLGNTAVTVATVLILAWLLGPLLRWAVLDATWTGSPEACAARGGACWAFVTEKLRFFVFAFYPAAWQWRSAASLVLLLVLIAASGVPRLWDRWLVAGWIVVPALACWLLGGWGSNDAVSTDLWGGLTLTVLLTSLGFAFAFPLGVLLALGRRSSLGGIRLLCVLVIELTRAIPLIAVLYIAMLIVPLALPTSLPLDKLLRAQAGIVVFAAAYMAETVRAGLQALAPGQAEAARALGLGPLATLRLVILPQALRAVIPGFANLAIGLLQNTPLVAVIGLFDFLNATRLSASDPQWLGFYNEAYLFAALIYFALSFGASRYSLWLERQINGRRER